MKDSGKVVLVLLSLSAAAGLGYLFLREKGEGALWAVGDIILCYPGGDGAAFKITGREKRANDWYYHMLEYVWEGEDLGWRSQTELLGSSWCCETTM